MRFRARLMAYGVVFSCASGTALGAGPLGTYYVIEASPGGVTPAKIWAINNGIVGLTDLRLDFSGQGLTPAPGPIAVFGDTVATTGSYGGFDRPGAQRGVILSGAPGLTLTDTGQYPLNVTTSEQFLDGTTDGTYNYMIGLNSSAQGTIYRCNLDWSNMTPVAQSRNPLSYTGITYDPRNNSFWLVGTWEQFNFKILSNVRIPATVGPVEPVRDNFIQFDNPRVLSLAMDLDYSLWMVDATNPGRLLHYSTETGAYLGDYFPTDPVQRPLGGEIALLGQCTPDFNHNGTLDFVDYLDFVDALSIGGSSADFNRDGDIDFNDYLDFVDAFSIGC